MLMIASLLERTRMETEIDSHLAIIEMVRKQDRERFAYLLERAETSNPKETFDLLVKEIMSEPYITDGNISTAIKRAQEKSPEYRKWMRRSVASARKPMNS